jgi:hypothetical protein
MSDDGYTLSDTLAALLIIGLAMSGAAAGLHVMARQQAATEATVFEASGAQRARLALNQMLAGQGPFRTKDAGAFMGTPSGFSFVCASHKPCAATIEGAPPNTVLALREGGVRLKTVKVSKMGALSFAYVGSRASSEVWPPAATGAQTLRQIALLATGPAGVIPIAHVDLWSEHPLDCAFDVVSQDCR